MNLINKCITCLLFVFAPLTAQWLPVSISSNDELSGVHFSTADVGFVGGRNINSNTGIIWKTTDGGNSWTQLIIPTVSRIRDVFFVDGNTGFAATSSETLLKTTDGGTNWTTQAFDANMQLWKIYFPTATTGYVIANRFDFPDDYYGRVYKTGDGGQSWTNVLQTNQFETLLGIHFENENIGYVLGGEPAAGVVVLMKTSNGGNSWVSQTNGITGRAVYALDANTAYAVGSQEFGTVGRILKTTSGGSNWNFLDHGYSPSIFTGTQFHAMSTGWVIGYGRQGNDGINYIIKTIDGGSVWHLQYSDSLANNLLDLHMVDDNIGYVVGENGLVLKTTNGGGTIVTSIDDDDKPQFTTYRLEPNYPNPFNPTTTIEFYVPVASRVTLGIHDVLGRHVTTLYRASLPAGTHYYIWDATDDSGNPVASGVYFYRLSAGDFQQVRKMLLVR